MTSDPVVETALACLLEYAKDEFVALPVHTSVELVERPPVTPVPGMPGYALGLMRWQGRQLGLIDLAHYLRQGVQFAEPPATPDHALVVAYQPVVGAPIAYGALNAPFLVRMVEVSNQQACDLPAGRTYAGVAVSCFHYQGRPVPVIDLACIFETRS